ncbi:hypothetical protein LTR53_001998 [Teratosphaeriaceae sp. CCFEE 6253]|nr:hypothetical protein LTR53_001998 [Teratosphaeriaceae sp. CCFEE 6253]
MAPQSLHQAMIADLETTMTILITGGSRGIGRATAILAGSKGWNVCILFKNDAEAARAAVDAVDAAGGTGLCRKADVSQEADLIDAFDYAEKILGPLHGVVINAGINAPAMPLAEMPAESLRRVFDTNVLGAYLCAREAARRLPKTPKTATRPTQSIVLLSSVAARMGAPGECVDYAGSKGAIDTLTLGLSKELGPQRVRVNGVRPGIIDTEIHASVGDAGRAGRMGQQVPLGRPGGAEEVAEAIVWLLGEQASYVSGTTIDVTGGR